MTDQLYGPVPPATFKRSEYALPVVPSGSGQGERIVMTGSFTVRLQFCETTRPLASVTWALKTVEVARTATPEIRPSEESERPGTN